MGILDQIMGAVGGASDGSAEGGSSLLDNTLKLINNPDTGGLSGLIQSFQEGGLGEAVKSWVSTGENMPILADQLKSVIGEERIENIAQQLGMSSEEASAKLADLLPTLIDKLTPDGNVPEEGDLVSRGLSLLKDRFSS